MGDTIIRLRKGKGWSQQEAAKKLADAFNATLDYLVDDTKQSEIQDKSLLSRIVEIDHLDRE
ncbi:MAG: hypothetical protein WA140_09255 [Geobacteraceae bacterium]